MSAADVHIEVEGNQLFLRGEAATRWRSISAVRAERPFGRFSRTSRPRKIEVR